jgi:hypothetical protein
VVVGGSVVAGAGGSVVVGGSTVVSGVLVGVPVPLLSPQVIATRASAETKIMKRFIQVRR